MVTKNKPDPLKRKLTAHIIIGFFIGWLVEREREDHSNLRTTQTDTAKYERTKLNSVLNGLTEQKLFMLQRFASHYSVPTIQIFEIPAHLLEAEEVGMENEDRVDLEQVIAIVQCGVVAETLLFSMGVAMTQRSKGDQQFWRLLQD